MREWEGGVDEGPKGAVGRQAVYADKRSRNRLTFVLQYKSQQCSLGARES